MCGLWSAGVSDRLLVHEAKGASNKYWVCFHQPKAWTGIGPTPGTNNPGKNPRTACQQAAIAALTFRDADQETQRHHRGTTEAQRRRDADT